MKLYLDNELDVNYKVEFASVLDVLSRQIWKALSNAGNSELRRVCLRVLKTVLELNRNYHLNNYLFHLVGQIIYRY